MINKKMGDYLITKSLGKGGFGSVWEAVSSDGTTVALKILNPQLLQNEKVVRKFFHEAMILARLDHPNICKLLEFFPDGDNYVIVMEFVQGVELKTLLSQHKGPLPFEQAYKIAKQTLDAFQYAHENGVLHRDIKPGNIMVDENDNAKIMDFGIAKMSSTASHDTALSMLSVRYVPPERFDRNKEIDARSDIYSLALVFYEMFAGRKPFSATESSEIMFSHLNEIPEPPKKYSINLPDEINQAILKALEKNPDDRFMDFREFSKALDIDEKTYDEATVIVHFDEPPREKKKKPVSLIVSVLILLVIAGALGGYLVMKKEPTQTIKPLTTAGKQAGEAARGFEEIQHPEDGSVMVLIPAGEFTMGSDQYSAEKPVQKIYLDKYYIDKFLVTNDQFQKFAEETNYVTDAEKEGYGLVRIGRRWKKVEGANWKKPDGLTTIEGKGDHPVSQVSYNDALSYCQWAKKDLPTEAQWEKAARGIDGSEYPWGNSEPNDTMANFDNIIGTTTPVTQYDKGKSYYGLYDMAGNVYQWCKDWYGTGERKTRNPTGPDSGTEHVIKGGSFIEGMESLRSSNRDRYEPNYSSFLFGFRCVKQF